MPIFGRYEVVEEVHASAAGMVARAKLVDGRHASFAVKLFHPVGLEDDELHWETQSFLERVRTQQQAAGYRMPGHWGVIRHQGTTPGGAYYVTDYYPLTAKKLIDSKIPVTAEALHRIVTGTLRGLEELRDVARRPHGNLKPANVLLSARGKGAADAHVALCDPASTAAALKDGDAGDRGALGQLIHQLVLHEPFSEGAIGESSAWSALGPQGAAWRELCAALLSGGETNPTADWTEIEARVASLAPPQRQFHLSPVSKPGASRKLRYTIAACVGLVVLAAVALSILEARTRREFCREKSQWLSRFAKAAADPQRRKAWGTDADLSRVLADVDRADPLSVHCEQMGLSPDPRRYRRIRSALSAARQISADLAPERWKQLGNAWERARRFEARGWTQPAELLADQISAAHPSAGANLAGAIDRILATNARLDRDLPALESIFYRLAERTRELDAGGDLTLRAFSRFLTISAGSSLRLSESGFSGREELDQSLSVADQLTAAVHGGYPVNIDMDRFTADVGSHLDLGHLQIGDVRHWLEQLPDYMLQREAGASASAALRSRLASVTGEIDASHPEPSEKAAIGQDEQKIAGELELFAQARFVARDFTSGAFNTQRSRLESEIDGLRVYLHRRNPQDWITSLAPLHTASDSVNGWWEDWKHVLQNSAPEMAGSGDLFAVYRQQTDRLRQLLLELDRTFPSAPGDLAGPLLATAKDRRERDLVRLLAQINPKILPPTPLGEKSAAEAYLGFCSDLRDLGRDFPLRRELLTPQDRPDETWRRRKPDFWNDPSVQALVKNDVQRIARLSDLGKLGRSDLIDAATTSSIPEVTFAAWQHLGAASVSPAWPTRPGELETERDLRAKVLGIVNGLKVDAERSIPLSALAAERPARWRRFVESAGSELMLQTATELESAFGVDTTTIARLSPVSRFNLSLYRAKQDARPAGPSGGDDGAVRRVIASIVKSAADLPDHKPVERLLGKLATIDGREPFADRNPGDRFALSITGVDPPLVFVRVEPPASRPFYLCSTALSFGQFAGVTDSASAWEQMKRFHWMAEQGKRDTRRGPRVWEWSSRSSLEMSVPMLWLTPDDDNDYPISFRISRFNRTALTDDVGGNPSTEHPMQYISCEAALYFAGLCGCRLPTSGEWRAAYSIYEKTVPPERWNLRDQTWETYKRYASAGGGTNIRWPDDGIFHPSSDQSPAGSDARSRPETDGTLFFRKVNGAGGGTFRQLIGNVAQFLCDAADAFEAWPEKGSAEGIGRFLEQNRGSTFVIGGSALSPPELPFDKPLALSRTDAGYADVGLRLAFTAPARSLAEKLKWALAGQDYLWRQPATAPAK